MRLESNFHKDELGCLMEQTNSCWPPFECKKAYPTDKTWSQRIEHWPVWERASSQT